MAITLSVKHDIARMTRGLDDMAREQIPYATAVALTRTAREVPKAAGDQMKRDLDSPKPFTTSRNAFYLKMARKQNLEAEVGFKDIQADYMRWNIAGGTRTQKRYEKALTGMGILPSGYVTIPSGALKTDRYGNIPLRTIAEIMGQLRTGMSTYSGKGRRAQSNRLFVVKPGSTDISTRHLSPGVWRSVVSGQGRKLQPLMLFVPDATYSQRFDLHGLGRTVVADHFQRHFQRALSGALKNKR